MRVAGLSQRKWCPEAAKTWVRTGWGGGGGLLSGEDGGRGGGRRGQALAWVCPGHATGSHSCTAPCDWRVLDR